MRARVKKQRRQSWMRASQSGKEICHVEHYPFLLIHHSSNLPYVHGSSEVMGTQIGNTPKGLSVVSCH